jgi:hypothetical protein
MTGRRHRPLYARVLRLKHITPGGLLCFVFLEGAVALGVLLALAELVSWWGVLLLPLMVALMVKLNDVIAGLLPRPAGPVAARAPVTRSAGHPAGETVGRPAGETLSRPAGDLLGGPVGELFDRPEGDPAARPVGESVGRLLGELSARPVGEDATTRLPASPDGAKRPWAERLEAQQQWARQSATRRYE